MSPRRGKVAHVTAVDLSLRLLLIDQLGALDEAGWEVHAVSSAGPDVGALEARGVRHHAVTISRSITPLSDLRSLLALVDLFERERFDIVHTHTPKAGLLGQIAARIAGVPIVVDTVHGFPFHEHTQPHVAWVYRALTRIAARQSDAIFSQSREDLETARRLRIGDPDRWIWLGNGIDLARFDARRFAARTRTVERRALGIPADAIVFAFVGRLVAEKGLAELCAALALARVKLPRLHLLIIGGTDVGKADAIDDSVATRAAVRDACTFLGRRDDIPGLLALADAFVLPSHREGFPRALMEAGAMGLPAIATRIRGCREVIVDGETGRLVAVKDAQALAAALVELGSDAELRQRWGQAAELRARQHFDQRQVFDVVMSTYDRLAQSRGRIIPRATSRTHRAPTPLIWYVGKRAFDLAIALPALVALGPAFVASVALVTATLGRPVLVAETCTGRGGRPFVHRTLRTRTSGSHGSPAAVATDGPWRDVFEVLRATGFDRIPALWNVIVGEMSVVGPAPLPAERLSTLSREEVRRFAVAPGLTGWVQVRAQVDDERRAHADLDAEYADDPSLWRDLEIVRDTVGLALRRLSKWARSVAIRRDTGAATTTDR